MHLSPDSLSPPPPSPLFLPCPQDPIKQPLLKKLASQSEEVRLKATSSFLDILGY